MPRATKRTSITAEHKAALAAGRSSGLAVKRYLEALAQAKLRRGRRSSPESLEKQVAAIDVRLQGAAPLERLHLVQERKDLRARLNTVDRGKDDLVEAEAAFIEVAAAYGRRKGISYSSWREISVPADVLRRAAVRRGAGS